MNSKEMIYFVLFITIEFSLVSDGQSCIGTTTCESTNSLNSYQFGGFLGACGNVNTTQRCIHPVGNGKTCQKKVRPTLRIRTYRKGSASPSSPKKLICYGFENVYGCGRGGPCRPHRVVCRYYNDTPAIPPVLTANLTMKNFHEVDVGGSLNIPCVADHAVRYKWIINTAVGRRYSEAQTIQITDASFKDQGMYTCEAFGRKGTVSVSQPQIVVVKGYLQFSVNISLSDNVNQIKDIGDIRSLLNVSGFNVSNGEEDGYRDVFYVFKLVKNQTASEVLNDLNETLKNASTDNDWTYTIINTGYCPNEAITEDGELTFPDTLVGVTANSIEISLTSNSIQRATRRCDGDYVNTASWENAIITNVKPDTEQNISASIENLEMNIEMHPVSDVNASYVAEVLKNVTESLELQTEHVDTVVFVLDKVVMTGNITEKVTTAVVVIVNNLVAASESNETDARLTSNTSATLLHTFEQQIDNVRDNGEPFNYTSTFIEVYIIKIIEMDVRVIYRTYFLDDEDVNIRDVTLDTDIFQIDQDNGNEGVDPDGKEKDDSKYYTDEPTTPRSNQSNTRDDDEDGGGGGTGTDATSIEDDSKYYIDEPTTPRSNQSDTNDDENGDGGGGTGTNATSIEVDRPAIENMLRNTTNDTDDGFPISFLLHRSTALFDGGHNDDMKINTLIVSASVNGVVKNLPDESNVITRFHPIERHRCAVPSCVYWDSNLNNGMGNWSTKGCRYVESESEDSHYTCHCNHLTNFAVLLDINGDINNIILDYLTVIGCVVSVWCIMVTIFTYLGIKKLRTSRPQQIVLNICFALLGLYISFLAGIDQAHNHIPCVIFGALIHFFTLASVTWMSVEATNMYLLFVKVFNIQINHFMIKASIIGWGIPAVIVLISAIVSPDTYSNCKYCFPDAGSLIFYISVLGVIVLLLSYNLVIFVLVTRKLTCARAKMTNRNVSRQETFRRIQNAVAISVLLGITWIFGLLAVGGARFFFNLLFCLTNSFQGCCIFLLFCVRQQEVRSAWMTWLRLSVTRVGPTNTVTSTATNDVSKGKSTPGGKSTSGIGSRGKMELSKVKNVSDVSVAEDPLNTYAEVGETSYDMIKPSTNLRVGPTIYQGYTELDARHRALPPLPEEGQYSKSINTVESPQAYMTIGESPTLFKSSIKSTASQAKPEKIPGSIKSTAIQAKAEKISSSNISSASSESGYGFVECTVGTLLQEANVRPTSAFSSPFLFKKSKRASKDKINRGRSTKH